MGVGVSKRQEFGRQLFLFGQDNWSLLPPFLRGPDSTARERPVLQNDGRSRSGGISPLQTLPSGWFVVNGEKQRQDREGMPADREGGPVCCARVPGEICWDERLSLSP